MTSSTFTKWLLANEANMPRAVFLSLKRAARERITERLQAGYSSAPLDFSDLWARGEAAICP